MEPLESTVVLGAKTIRRLRAKIGKKLSIGTDAGIYHGSDYDRDESRYPFFVTAVW
jgi:hypothetical protein